MFSDRAAEAHERGQAAAGQAGQQPVDQLLDGGDAEAGLEDFAHDLFHRPGAGEFAAALADRGKDRSLVLGEIVGVLQQRPAGVLELLGGVGLARLAQLVPVLAADLVQRRRRHRDDVVVVDHDLGLGRVLADRLGVAAGHVHRDCGQPGGARDQARVQLQPRLEPRARDAVAGRHGRAGAERDHDRRLRLPRAPSVRGRVRGWRIERVKEGVGGRLALAVGAPHRAAFAVVADQREVAVALAPRDLIHRDLKQIAQPVGTQKLVADALDDPPNGLPIDPQKPRDRGLIRLGRQPRDQIVEVAREPGAVAGKRHALHVHPVLGAAKAPQPGTDLQPPAPPRDPHAARPNRDAACSPGAASCRSTSGTAASCGAGRPRPPPGRARSGPS